MKMCERKCSCLQNLGHFLPALMTARRLLKIEHNFQWHHLVIEGNLLHMSALCQLALLCARTSAGTVMTKFGYPYLCLPDRRFGPHLQISNMVKFMNFTGSSHFILVNIPRTGKLCHVYYVWHLKNQVDWGKCQWPQIDLIEQMSWPN